MPHRTGCSVYTRKKKRRFQNILKHTAKSIVAYAFDSAIMQAEDEDGQSSYVNADEYMYISPHAYIIRKPAAARRSGKKKTSRATRNIDVRHERATGDGKSCVDEEEKHLESIYYDASNQDNTSEIIDAANMLSKWAIETSQEELRIVLEMECKEKHMEEISRGTKKRLKQEVVKSENRAKRRTRRDRDKDSYERRCEDSNPYEAESQRLVQIVTDTVLTDMESEFRKKELDDLERSIKGYESVVAAKALWLAEEVMGTAVSEIQKELACLQDKISRCQRICAVDEAMLSGVIGDIVNRTITNAMQDIESKKLNLEFTELGGESRTIPTEVYETAVDLAKRAICDSVEDIAEAVRKSSLQDTHEKSSNYKYTSEIKHDGEKTVVSKLDVRPNVNVKHIDTRITVPVKRTKSVSGGTKPMYSSTKYVPISKYEEPIQETEPTSPVRDRVISRKYITLTGNHGRTFSKEYPPVNRPSESLDTITSADESQEALTEETLTPPPFERDTSIISRRQDSLSDSRNRMLNEYRRVSRPAEGSHTASHFRGSEEAVRHLGDSEEEAVSHVGDSEEEETTHGDRSQYEVSQIGDSKEIIPMHSNLTGKTMSFKQHITLKRDHKRITKQYIPECMPFDDDDTGEYTEEEEIEESVPCPSLGDRNIISRRDITLTNDHRRCAKGPVSSRVRQFEGSRVIGSTASSPGNRSMRSTQDSTFDDTCEGIIHSSSNFCKNICRFEESQRPKRRPVGEGIRHFEESQRSKISPESVRRFEGSQRTVSYSPIIITKPQDSRGTLATDQRYAIGYEDSFETLCPVDENIRSFEGSQRAVSYSPSIIARSQDSRGTLATDQRYAMGYDDSIQTLYPVDENIRSFEDSQRPKLSPESIRRFEGSQRTVSYSPSIITRPQETESRLSSPQRDTSIISRKNITRSVSGHEGSFETLYPVGENVRHFEDLQRPKRRPVGEGIRQFEDSQRQKISPESIIHFEGTPRSSASSARGGSVISRTNTAVRAPSNGFDESIRRFEGSNRSTARSLSPSIKTKSQNSRGTLATNQRHAREHEEIIETLYPVSENIVRFEDSTMPKRRPVGEGIRQFEDSQRPKISPESIIHFEGTPRSRASSARGGSVISRTDTAVRAPSGSFGENISRFEGSQRSTSRSLSPSIKIRSQGSRGTLVTNQRYEDNTETIRPVDENIRRFEGAQRSMTSSAGDRSIISKIDTTLRESPAEGSVQDERLAEGSVLGSHLAESIQEMDYPSDDIRSHIDTIIEETTTDDECESVAHTHGISLSQRDTTSEGRSTIDKDYRCIDYEDAIGEMLLMQKLLAETETGISQTERVFQKLLDSAICDRLSTVAKKAVVTTVLDKNLEERIQCGLLILNVTYSLHLNISECSLSPDMITMDAKQFVHEILNGISSHKTRDILRMKGDILNGFEIQMNLEKIKINGHESSICGDD
ncbi:uncharacterized protein LOC121370529 [Gigantopelta aegis]|uniref:uncharacterized protein LOC121370529 n=1 Tax=Gigantopelta aegis TaxID=1735272 RepID=UPI001B88CB36|nr:uncharacterized protein LOC121370529 [Gigantopelta aegis]